MKRLFIAAMVAALTIPVMFAGPVLADTTFHVRLDPRDWAWSGTITYGCDEPTSVQFTLQPNAGLQHILDFTIGTWDECDQPKLSVSTLTDGNASYYGQSMTADIEYYLVSGWKLEYFSPGDPDSGIPITFVLGDLDDGRELKMFPRVFASDMRSNNVIASGNFNTADTRSKITNYVTLQPNRVTVMAKRFVDAPNSIINIHGYGPDKDVALARANHIRDHLISEITRLGGDPANYPTIVVYAGDPDHKKGVHVTIHQHSVRAIGTGGW